MIFSADNYISDARREMHVLAAVSTQMIAQYSTLRQLLHAGTLVLISITVATEKWQWWRVTDPSVKDASAVRYLGVSGIAFLNQQNGALYFVIVHDGKPFDDEVFRKNVPRVGILKVPLDKSFPSYVPLHWPGKAPDDLEAVAAIPNQPGHFMALTAYGDLFRFSVDNKLSGITLQKSFKIPTAKYRGSKPEFEGFTIQSVNEKVIAAWAERGWNHGEFTAQMWWSTFNVATNSFARISGPVPVEVPLETKCKRHISDIKVAGDGRVYISSATDCDDINKPPFESAAFEIGRFNMGKDNVFEFCTNGTLKIFDGSREWKIEALESMPPGTGRFIFGSDDELDGGRIFVQW